jgi:signal transduction histidine kinase
MRSYRDLPIRTKLQGIIVVTSGVALLVASAWLSIYARATLLRSKMRELDAAAKIVGSNSTAALAFGDPKAAAAILATLRAYPNVTLACTYDREGKVFASYHPIVPGANCPIAQPEHAGNVTAPGRVALFQNVALNGQSVGTIFVQSDLKDLNGQVARFLGIAVLSFVASVAVALALASFLQRIISEPILQLAATALSVDRYRDYSIQARKMGDDELGALVDAFNHMLEHIHARDVQLQAAHDQMEKRVDERTAHLNALMEDNKKMEIELRHAQKLEAVGALAAGIAHEINTPIQFVSDNTRFLRDAFRGMASVIEKYEKVCEEAAQGAPSPQSLHQAVAEREQADWEYVRQEIPKAIEQAEEGLGRVATIVRAMKDFSHVNHNTGMSAADLNQALQSTLIVARNELKYVADVDCDYGKLPPVVCNLGDLNQVFLNLLINAAHAIGDVVKQTGQKGRISVRTRLQGSWVELAVSDTGTGIPTEIRDKVFDPFFTTKEVGKGTGQGLAIARSIIVTRHGGTLTFDTELGCGTTFYVRLPVDGKVAAHEAVSC